MPLYQTVLFAAAIAVVFTQGEIFNFLRRGPWIWRELASCPLCSGVWLGAGMYLLFYGFPHAGGDLLTILSSISKVLGIGSLSGCVATLFVVVWERLDEPAAAISIENASITATRPSISAPRVQIVSQAEFTGEEAPTEPTAEDNRLTKKVSTERLPIAKSRRSNPE